MNAVGDRYWLQTEATYAHPASIRLRSSTVLHDKIIGADAVIVTPADFLSAAEDGWQTGTVLTAVGCWW